VKLPITAFANPNDVSNALAVSFAKLTSPKLLPATVAPPPFSRFMLWVWFCASSPRPGTWDASRPQPARFAVT
jgi:hypothetical protein